MYEVVYNLRGFISYKKHLQTRETFRTFSQAEEYAKQLVKRHSSERKYLVEDVHIVDLSTGHTTYLL